MAGIQCRTIVAIFALGERLNGYNREGEAPAEPKPSSAGASHSHWNSWQVVFCLPLALAWFLCGNPAIGSEEIELLFAKRILPLFKEKCFGCHGNDSESIKADFDMRTIESIVRGGESGVAALVPKDARQSPLYLAIGRTHDQWSAMPPKENDRLNDKQIEWIEQ